MYANKGTRYDSSLVGNSPELMRALDCHGFNDFKQSTYYHVALTSVYPLNDPDRMFDGTPKQLEETMTKCWTLEPTSERIVEDIQGLQPALEKIIAAKGADCDLRSGRRQQKLNWMGKCKGRTRKSQRISTIQERPTHPTAMRAIDLLIAEAEEEFERVDAARLRHELLAFEDDSDEDEDVPGLREVEDDEDDEVIAMDPNSDEESAAGDEEEED